MVVFFILMWLFSGAAIITGLVSLVNIRYGEGYVGIIFIMPVFLVLFLWSSIVLSAEWL